MKEFLQTRRSASIAFLTQPAPTKDELHEILTIGARVPDHGKLFPWYFVVFEGDARAQFGNHIRDAWAKNNPDATPDALNKEQNRFMQAPLVIAVISRIREAKIPAWEQILSAGACCYNVCLAANACGFGANWITGWYTYDEDIRTVLGLENGRDNIAGFIYIGTESQKQEKRERPDMDKIINYWTSHKTPDKKGDNYNKDGLGSPNHGFTIIQSSSQK